MRIFAAGDFHGKVPKKFKKIAQTCDIMLCTGDTADRDEERKFYFKNWRVLHSGKDVFDLISKSKFAKMLVRGIKSMIPVVNEIDSWGIPVMMINGNGDFTRQRIKELARGLKMPKGLPVLEKLTKESRHVNLFQNSVVDFDNEYQLITWYSGDIPEEFDTSLLKALFKGRMKNKKIIFLTHEPPHGCKLDIAEMGPMKGKHIGNRAVKWAIKKYKPALNISGHIHGGQGKTRIGGTVCVNAGYGRKGQAAVVELGRKIKVELIQ